MAPIDDQLPGSARPVRAAPQVLFCETVDEAVLLDQESGLYYGLDAVGTRFWKVLMEVESPEAAREVLLREFEVSPEQLTRDLQAFLRELAEARLVTVGDEPAAKAAAAFR